MKTKSILWAAVASVLLLKPIPLQATEIALWNLNSYDPVTEFTSLANAGTQNGTAILDWSAFSIPGASVQNPAPDFSSANSTAYLSKLPDGQAAGTGLGLNGNRHLDFKFAGTGFDYLTVRGYANSVLSVGDYFGSWQYSTNNGASFSAAQNAVQGDSILFNSPDLANQANVILRLSQYYQPGNIRRYDNFSVSGNAYNGLAITGENDKRIVKGGGQALTFTLSERSGADQEYSVTGTGITEIQDVANGANPNPSIIARSSNTISGIVETEAANAGDTIAATLTANSTTPGVNPVSKTVNVQVLENRSLSLVGSGDLGDLGRVVAGSPLATLTVTTDAKTDSEATRITMNSGTFYAPVGWSGSYYYASPVGGLNFTVQTANVFDSANETSQVVVRANPGGGLGVQTFSADLKNARTGYYSLPDMFKAETALGSNLSGVDAMHISGSATVLTNRDLTAASINLGREMVGAGTEPVTGNATIAVQGGAYGDSQATRVALSQTASPLTANGITVTIAETTTFNSANQTANVGVDYSLNFDRSQTGRQTASASIAGQLSSGEAPSLAGVVVDTGLDVTVEKTFVANRQIIGASSVYAQALAGTTVDAISNFITTIGDDAHNTRILVNGTPFTNWYDSTYDTVTVNQSSAVSKQATSLGTKTLTAVGEGLANETPDSLSWGYGVEFFQAASATVSANVSSTPTGILAAGNTGLTLGVGDSVTVASAAKNDGGTGERASTQVFTGFVGNNGFSLSGLGYGVGAGDSQTGTVAFDSAGKLNGIHSARLDLTLSNNLSLLGSSVGDLGTYAFSVSHTVTGNSGNGGLAYVASGSRLKDSGIQAAFSNSVLSQATTAALKDSETLGANVEIQIAFDSINNATGSGAQDLVSDTVSLAGLDGIKFVLQVGYDEATLINKFGTEEVAILTWLDLDDSTWKNAIEGNSNHGVSGAENAFGKRFRMSYDSYLATRGDGAPRLNDFGYDPTANTMWAVLDHNSEFGGSGFDAVPEPSTYALLVLGGAVAFFISRRKKQNI